VRTPKNSQNAASFWPCSTADIRYVDADEIDRRSRISGTYSAWFTNSSPIATGIAESWRSVRSTRRPRAQTVFEEEQPGMAPGRAQPDRLIAARVHGRRAAQPLAEPDPHLLEEPGHDAAVNPAPGRLFDAGERAANSSMPDQPCRILTA
jgi:hypothetical protein